MVAQRMAGQQLPYVKMVREITDRTARLAIFAILSSLTACIGSAETSKDQFSKNDLRLNCSSSTDTAPSGRKVSNNFGLEISEIKLSEDQREFIVIDSAGCSLIFVATDISIVPLSDVVDHMGRFSLGFKYFPSIVNELNVTILGRSEELCGKKSTSAAIQDSCVLDEFERILRRQGLIHIYLSDTNASDTAQIVVYEGALVGGGILRASKSPKSGTALIELNLKN